MNKPEAKNFFENTEWNRKIIPEKAQLEASRALIEVLHSIDEKLEKICLLLQQKQQNYRSPKVNQGGLKNTHKPSPKKS